MSYGNHRGVFACRVGKCCVRTFSFCYKPEWFIVCVKRTPKQNTNSHVFEQTNTQLQKNGYSGVKISHRSFMTSLRNTQSIPRLRRRSKISMSGSPGLSFLRLWGVPAADASVWNGQSGFARCTSVLSIRCWGCHRSSGRVCILCALCFCLTRLGQAAHRSAGGFSCFPYIF